MSALVIVAMLFSVLIPIKVKAFSGYGAGTASKPYRISTCAQLSEIDADLSGYYVIIRDIDCGGASLSYLAGVSAFTGVLDGRNHTISNININRYGIFYETNGATIKNIKISGGTLGSITGSSYAGSYVGIASSTLLENVHSDLTMNTISGNMGGIYVGGLVGLLNGGSTITQSSFKGSLYGNTYTGGLAGVSLNANVIRDSYSTGIYHLSSLPGPPLVQEPVYNGGILGSGSSSTTIERVYSAMTISVSTGSTYTGGLIGSGSGIPLSDSFGAATINDMGGIFTGGIAGAALPLSNVNYDDYLASGLDCAGAGGAVCSGINIGNSQPGYYKNNSTSAPLSSWDFNTVWRTGIDYPILRAEDNFIVSSTPNGGDANGDATSDAVQPHVTSVANTSGVWSTVEIPSGSGCTVDDAEAVNARSIKLDSDFSSVLSTMTGFKVYCSGVGASVPVTIIYDKEYDVTNAVLRQYNPSTNMYITVAGATFGTRTIGGIIKTAVTYTLTDGGSYDNDGVADGIIIDPVGFAVLVPAKATTASGSGAINAPNTGLQAGDNSAVYICLLIMGVLVGARGLKNLHRAYSRNY